MNVLDAAFHIAHDHPGGAAALAVRMGKAQSTLCHELKGEGFAKLGLVDAVKLSHLTGSAAIAQAFATELGGVYVQLAPVGAAQGDLQGLGTAIKEFGEFAGSFSQALADGHVTANELRSLEREAMEAMAAISTVLALARDRHEAGKPAHLRAVVAVKGASA